MNALYLIEVQHPRLGRWFLETDRDSNSRTHAIRLISSGEANAIKVLEVNEGAGTCKDVTTEILEEAEAFNQLVAAE
jgi:hypothetical protein